VYEAFGVSEDATKSWWNDFAGWYEGVDDESDGMVEDPDAHGMRYQPSRGVRYGGLS
jgi:hypothetical protein